MLEVSLVMVCRTAPGNPQVAGSFAQLAPALEDHIGNAHAEYVSAF